MRQLEGKVALVTGGAGAIGAAVVEALASAGATVVSADKVAPSAKGVRAGIHTAALDVTARDEVARLVAQIVERHGALDMLVNAAGVVSFGSAATLEEAEWDRVLDINLKGVFLACQAAMAPMKANGFGRIVNVGSVVGKNAGNARPGSTRASRRARAMLPMAYRRRPCTC